MKKGLLLLAVMGLFAFSTTVFAASKTTVLQDCNGTLATEEGGIHANAHRTVTIKTTHDGGADVTVQILSGAIKYTYVVRSKGVELGVIITDKKGNGVLSVHVASVSDLGQWVAMWETDNLNGDWDIADQLLCAWNPFFVSTP